MSVIYSVNNEVLSRLTDNFVQTEWQAFGHMATDMRSNRMTDTSKSFAWQTGSDELIHIIRYTETDIVNVVHHLNVAWWPTHGPIVEYEHIVLTVLFECLA